MLSIMILMILIIIISFFFLILNLLLSKKINMMRLKLSSFECGFEMFESIRLPFSIHFYLIAVLFLLFDVEILFLFPMVISLKILNYKVWLVSSLLILMILFIGLEYEKNEGSLSWFI